jgi:hypothetical protein
VPLAAASVNCDANTRFVLLTDRLFRAEYDASGLFEDRATMSIINRALAPPPVFDVSNSTGTWCNISTKAGLRISYNKQASGGPLDAPFRRHALSAGLGNITWETTMVPSGNLGGTLATLSNQDGAVPLDCTGLTGPNTMTKGDKVPFYCTLGVASRDGWAVVNDTLSTLIDPATDWIMRNPRASPSQSWSPAAPRTTEDLYLFLYGSDYPAAVAALTLLSGSQPVPPRHTFGVHWSRYWQYSAAELRAEVKAFEAHSLPLDLLNLDTGWHTNKCAFLDDSCPHPGGPTVGYGGIYQWDENLFPGDYADASGSASFLGWLEVHNLSSYLDIHQTPGVMKENANYAEFGAAVGLSPAQVARGETIPTQVHNRTATAAFFNLLTGPQVSRAHKNQFFWIDYNGQPDAYSAWNHGWNALAGKDKWTENHFYQYVLWQPCRLAGPITLLEFALTYLPTHLELPQIRTVEPVAVLQGHGAEERAREQPCLVRRPRQPALPARPFRRRGLLLGQPALPVSLHGHGCQRRLRVLVARPGRAQAR